MHLHKQQQTFWIQSYHDKALFQRSTLHLHTHTHTHTETRARAHTLKISQYRTNSLTVDRNSFEACSKTCEKQLSAA